MEIEISNGRLTATISPKGAELTSLKATSGKEFIWEGNPEYWGKHSPVLFPIVGTLKNNAYQYNGREYAMKRHGFAREYGFSVKRLAKDNVVFMLSENVETLGIYPFRFTLELEYSIEGNVLHINYTVINNDDKVMPFSLGAHPAFALPGNFEDYSLRFEKDRALVSAQLENDLLSGTTVGIPLQEDGILLLNYSLFEKDALIFKDLKSDSVEILKDAKPYLRVAFPGFPHLGIWTKQGAPFLCIEPWQGYSDYNNSGGNILEKEGIITLQSQESYSAGFKIEILA